MLDSSWTGSEDGEQAGMALAALALPSWVAEQRHPLSSLGLNLAVSPLSQCHGSHLGLDSYPSLTSLAPDSVPQTCRMPPSTPTTQPTSLLSGFFMTHIPCLPSAWSIPELWVLWMLIRVPWAFLLVTESLLG